VKTAKTTASANGTKRNFAGPSKEHHGHEDDTDRECGDEGRRGNLLRAVEDRLLERFAHREIAMDVLDLDRGVIDERCDGQPRAAEGHHY